VGGVGGLLIGTLGVVGAARRYPAFNQLTLPLKVFLVSSAGTFGGIIAADHASRTYEASINPADQARKSRLVKERAAEVSGLTWTQRAMLWGREERYKIVGGSWLLSMVAAFGLVGRNPYLSVPQKLVQARVYAQGLTLAVLIASAALEVQDSREQRGRYETVEYVDEKDHTKKTKQVEREQPSDGDATWKVMVEEEEARLKERDDAIKRREEQDRKQRANNHPKKSKKADKPKEGEKAAKSEEKGGSQKKGNEKVERDDKEETDKGDEEKEEQKKEEEEEDWQERRRQDDAQGL
jgi:hypothetical protein